MSLITERFLLCDGLNCGEAFGVEDGSKTGAQHREAAERAGWYNRSKVDYCPTCKRKQVQPNNSRAKPFGPMFKGRIT